MATLTFTGTSHILRGALHCSVPKRSFSLWSSAILNATRHSACPRILQGNILRRVLPTAVPSRPISTPSKILQFVRSDVWRATHRGGRAPLPPQRRRQPSLSTVRQRIDSLPSSIFVWGILAINGVVLLVWGYANGAAEATRDITWLRWMYQNFLVSLKNVEEGRWWTILTSCFSHQDVMHFSFNALTYYFMAPAVVGMLGNTSFLMLYLGGGILSSCTSLAYNAYARHADVPSQGASGAIYSVISFFACVAPRAEFLIFYVVPCPAWAVVGGIFLWDSWRSITQSGGKTDTAGHVGGLLAGAGYYILKRLGVRI